MKEYDKIKIKSGRYINRKVYPGMVGYILEEYKDGKFEVEFSEPETGETIALLVLGVDEIEVGES